MTDLVITNGDSAGELLRRTLQGAEVLPWRDILHEGPVPFTDSRDELSAVRVSFLAEAGAGAAPVLEDDFAARFRGLGIR